MNPHRWFLIFHSYHLLFICHLTSFIHCMAGHPAKVVHSLINLKLDQQEVDLPVCFTLLLTELVYCTAINALNFLQLTHCTDSRVFSALCCLATVHSGTVSKEDLTIRISVRRPAFCKVGCLSTGSNPR